MRKAVLSIFEVAQLLGLHKNTVRRQIWRGELKAIRIGRRLLVPIAEVERLVGPLPEGALRDEETPREGGV